MNGALRDRLGPVLTRAQGLGFVGPGPVTEQIEHAEALVALLGEPTDSFLDLGSGAGLPGLVVALRWPTTRGVLLDAGQRRGQHLTTACTELGLTDRIAVVVARAEDAARDPLWRESVDLVIARGFGAPATTAECAVGFLRPGGRLAVSEPPGGDPARWDKAGLAQLGLSGPEITSGAGASVAGLALREGVDPRWPRRSGVPAHRPLWT